MEFDHIPEQRPSWMLTTLATDIDYNKFFLQ
jgi:hypothetical protein